MPTITRNESGYDFALLTSVTYFPEDTYPIDGVKHVDFIARKPKGTFYIEVKSTFANPVTSPKNYEQELSDIADKFLCSLLLRKAVVFGRHENRQWPGPLIGDKANASPHRFVLIITKGGFKKEWCQGLKDKLTAIMRPYTQAFGNSTVFVWTPDIAHKNDFTCSPN